MKTAVVALVACLGCRHAACPEGGDERAACLVKADVEQYFHQQEKLLGLFEQEIGRELAGQPIRCGSGEDRAGDPAFLTLQSRLPVLIKAANLAGATIAIACGDRASVVAKAGSEPTGFAGLGERAPPRELAWGAFASLPRGLEVKSEVPLAHDKAKLDVLYRLP